MLSFKLLFEAVHKHSTHIEDLAIIKGSQGIKDALDSYKDILNALKNKKSVPISIKKDGAPSLFCGYLNGQFFMGTKSIFNKVPKICYSEDDIEKNYSEELAATLKTAFKYLKEFIPENGKIYQGDLLYVKTKLFSKTIDGIDSWCFQPNTIMYTVPKNSPLGKKIGNSEIGICFHTHYSSDGIDPKSIFVTDFSVSEDEFKTNSDVVLFDPYCRNESAMALLTPEQTEDLEKIIREIEKANEGIVSLSEKMQYHVLVYVNSFYKMEMIPADKRFDGFLDYLETLMNQKAAEKKTRKGQEAERLRWIQLKNEALEIKSSLSKLFLIHSKLNDAKLIIKSYLDKLNSSKNFFVRKDGTIEATGEEGYIVVSGSANSCKIVDRGAFSKVNFDVKNIYQKGWKR